MRNRSSRSALLVAAALLSPALVAAQKLDKDDKKFLDDVRPILLTDEEKTLQGPQGEGRPARVPEDLLGSPGPRPRDARERVPGRVPRRAGGGRPDLPCAGPGGLDDRLRAHLHPPRQAGRGPAGVDGEPRPAPARDLDLPRPARADVRGRQGRDRVRPRVPGAGRVRRPARPRGGGQGDPAQHRLPHGEGRPTRRSSSTSCRRTPRRGRSSSSRGRTSPWRSRPPTSRSPTAAPRSSASCGATRPPSR